MNKLLIRWRQFWSKASDSNAVTRVVRLKHGHLILTASVSPFELPDNDRELMFGIVDLVENYEKVVE
jgi:hypothetical protein